MAASDVAAFYRNSDDQFVLAVGVGRTAAVGLKTSEAWYPASGRFALPMAAHTRWVDAYSVTYVDIYGVETSFNTPMTVARPSWIKDKASSNAVLYAGVNAALTQALYTAPNGDPIT